MPGLPCSFQRRRRSEKFVANLLIRNAKGAQRRLHLLHERLRAEEVRIDIARRGGQPLGELLNVESADSMRRVGFAQPLGRFVVAIEALEPGVLLRQRIDEVIATQHAGPTS